MKKYIIIHFVVLTFSLIYTVSSGDITAAKKNVEEALINDTVVMKWQVTPGQNQKILSLLLYVLPDDIQVIQGILLPVVTPQGKPLFQDRLTATFNTAGKNEYIATLERIQYKDNHTYQLRVVFDDAINFERKNATIQIKSVVGSPSFCGKRHLENYDKGENETLTVTQDICGYPKSVVNLTLEGDSTFSNSLKRTLINDTIQQYRYEFKTRKISRGDCGKQIILNAANQFGTITSGAKINVSFTPSRVSELLSHKLNQSCVYVSWEKENIGKCVMSYYLQFDDAETEFHTFSNTYTKCNLANASNVTVWASFSGKVGPKMTSNISEIPTTTITTTITKTVTTSKATSNTTPDYNRTVTNGTIITKPGESSNIGLIVGIVGGILFVIIIIVIIVCVLKHKKKNGTGNHSGYAMRVTGEENNYVTDPTRRNEHRPVNPDDPEQAIYSELGPGGGRTGPRPAPEQSDYAEMKVDAMGYPIDGAKSSEPPTYAPVIKPREGAKRRTPSPPRSNVDGARAAASAEPPAYAPIIKNRSSSRGRSPPPDEDDHEGVIV